MSEGRHSNSLYSVHLESDSMEAYDHINIQEQIRVLGTLQINIGMFHLILGCLWYYLKLTQFTHSTRAYKTFVTDANYPINSALVQIISGTVTIITEKKHKRYLVIATVVVNIIGIIYSIYGLILLAVELLINNSDTNEHDWPESSGNLLSNYLFIYTLIYIFISWAILRKNHRAIFYSSM